VFCVSYDGLLLNETPRFRRFRRWSRKKKKKKKRRGGRRQEY